MMTFHWTIFWCNETNMFVLLLVVLCLTMIFLRFLKIRSNPENRFFYYVMMTNIAVVWKMQGMRKKNDAHASAMWFFEIYFLFVTNTKKLYFLFTHFMFMCVVVDVQYNVLCSMLVHVGCSLGVIVSWRKNFSVMMHEEKSKWEMRGRKKRSISISLYESIDTPDLREWRAQQYYAEFYYFTYCIVLCTRIIIITTFTTQPQTFLVHV